MGVSASCFNGAEPGGTAEGRDNMTRSLPEKTFEHWASMYVAHRFPHGSLWWPTSGEDVRVDDLGTVPGKAILLELKVPEQQSAGGHVVTIDLEQLLRYLGSPVPVYYAFPEPPWSGTLITSGWLGPERRADLAYRRTRDRWFGKWTVVCSAADLYSHLSPPTAALTKQVTHPFPGGWDWAAFWGYYKACGSLELPSLFIVSEDVIQSGQPPETTNRGDLRGYLRSLRSASLQQSEVLRERTRGSFQDSSRYVYGPTLSTQRTDEYRLIGREELDRTLRGLFTPSQQGQLAQSRQDLAICSVPFEGLDA